MLQKHPKLSQNIKNSAFFPQNQTQISNFPENQKPTIISRNPNIKKCPCYKKKIQKNRQKSLKKSSKMCDHRATIQCFGHFKFYREYKKETKACLHRRSSTLEAEIFPIRVYESRSGNPVKEKSLKRDCRRPRSL